MQDGRIVAVTWGTLEGARPRHAGKNARISDHGLVVRVPVAQIVMNDGATGFGWSRISQDEARTLLGQRLDDLWHAETGPVEAAYPYEYPLWDLMAKRQGMPVYALAAQMAGKDIPASLRVPCYDTSLYIDDLAVASEGDAAALIAAEAREGYARGHRAFKIKVGRGARWMPVEEGTRRDIAVIRAVREAVGPGLPLMIDGNNGYTLNLAKRVLAETADCGIFWLEEPFHEDLMLYEDLKAWLAGEGLSVLIADGEGDASPRLMEWAAAGAIDVVQYDIFRAGFTRWFALGHALDAIGRRSAPHHYGGHLGNYYAPHLAPSIAGFTYAEWDEASTPGLDTSAYHVEDGLAIVPALPGFGLALDEERLRLSPDGWTVRA